MEGLFPALPQGDQEVFLCKRSVQQCLCTRTTKHSEAHSINQNTKIFTTHYSGWARPCFEQVYIAHAQCKIIILGGVSASRVLDRSKFEIEVGLAWTSSARGKTVRTLRTPDYMDGQSKNFSKVGCKQNKYVSC